MSKILVFIDQFKGTALTTSWEALGAGQEVAGQLGGEVAAVVLGSDVGGIATQAFQHGAAEVFVADDPALADFRVEPYASVLSKIVAEAAPEVILLPTTTRGRDLAAMTAVDLSSGVLVDCTALEVVAGKILATRPIYAGKALCKVQCNANPQIVTLRSRAFSKPEPDASKTGTPTQVEVALAEADIATQVIDYVEAEGGVSLNDAAVIVSGGRGVSNNPNLTPPDNLDDKGKEVWRAQQGFKLVGDLAATLGGAVGASRASVDAGYVPYAHQVGQTGKVVSPDLYIACGISGAIQHLAGMRTSKVIVAVNKDPDAPIFKLARFGVVGDLFEILPPLTTALKECLGK